MDKVNFYLHLFLVIICPINAVISAQEQNTSKVICWTICTICWAICLILDIKRMRG